MPPYETRPVAQVALNDTTYGYDQCYSYYVPEPWSAQMQIGMRVVVPFGHGNRRRLGMVLSIHPTPPLAKDGRPLVLKPIVSVLDSEPILAGERLALVHFLHERTFCTWYEAVRTVLPGGMHLRLEQRYTIVEPPANVTLTPEEENYLDCLRHAHAQQETDLLIQADEDAASRAVRKSLQEKGCLIAMTEAKPVATDKTCQMLRLSPEYRANPTQFQPTPKQRMALQIIEAHEVISVKECAYYAGVTPIVIKNLVKAGIAEQFEVEMLRVPRDAKVTTPPEQTILTTEQQAAYDAVAAAMDAGRVNAFLLHGVTGSGKTAVFQQLIAHALQQGKQALLLIPEIALTPQIVHRFEACFGNQVALIHSSLSVGQRRDTDKLIQRGEVNIVIGTRSAVFAPLPRLGIIILDEEGERSYKSDMPPRYHAADVARERCKTHQAVLLLASATPSLESRYLAEKGVYQLLTLKQRYNQAALPHVTIVDMNEERMHGNMSPFSVTLAEAMQENLAQGKQSILLLNRRGYRTMLLCSHCKKPVYCPNCSVPLTLHKVNHSLMCHYCGHIQPLSHTCPDCGGETLQEMGLGTQRLEEELQALLPAARILRMDADTTMTRSAYETNFQAFAEGKYDIMCGTQMIGKGLDFPNVTLVGVISIDKALYAGDFRSYERTFSLITQVVGRSGRGTTTGRAILQTAMPEHYVLAFAANQDYEGFYREELAMRRALMFPPICDICVIGLSAILEANVKQAAERFLVILQKALTQDALRLPLRVLGPVEANYQKIGGRYRQRVLLKCKNTAQMRQFIRKLLQICYADKHFRAVSIYADMNGDCGV